MTASLAKQPLLDQWIAITADGRVIVRSGKVEIGQRISTALAAIAAEELDVALHRIDMVNSLLINYTTILFPSAMPIIFIIALLSTFRCKIPVRRSDLPPQQHAST